MIRYRVAELSLCILLMGCAAPVHQLRTSLPSPTAVYLDSTLLGMGYVLAVPQHWDPRGGRRRWLAVRAGHEDRLELRTVARSGYTTSVTGGQSLTHVVWGYELWISARTYDIDSRGKRRAVRPSAGVVAEADSLGALVRGTVRRRGGPGGL